MAPSPGIPSTLPLYFLQSLWPDGTSEDCSTRAEYSGHIYPFLGENHNFLFLANLAAMYFTGVVFGIIWIAIRGYYRQDGSPWLPNFCRTDACCVWFEPIARFWPAVLWPLFLLWVLICFMIDNASHATNCCGFETRKSKRRKRLEAAAKRNRDLFASEFESEPSETISQRSSVILTPLSRMPRSTYATYHAVPDIGSWSPSRTNSITSVDRLSKSRYKSSGAWVFVPGRGDRSPSLPPYQSRSNSAQNIALVGTSGAKSAGSVNPPRRSRASSASTSSNSQPGPTPNPGDSRPISIRTRRVSVKYNSASSPLQRSESVDDIDPQVAVEMGGSSAHDSDNEDSPVVLEMGGDLSRESTSSMGGERAARN